VPPPDPWVKGGAALILANVRKGKVGETVSLLDLNLKDLEKDFSLCPWVKKVLRIDRSNYGRLIVHLAYRKPVAVVPFKKFEPRAFVLDDEAVVLPYRDIDWTMGTDPYEVRGISCPLITIQGVPDSSPAPTFGLPWKRKIEMKVGEVVDERDPFVLKAAIIARFLQDRKLSLKSPDEAPDFVSIRLPDGPDDPFVLYDRGDNLVCWGKAPGDEKPGEPFAEARWDMLLEWVRTHGPLIAQWPNCLYFSSSGARLTNKTKSPRKI
jgi:hypothetical protein